MTPIQNDLSKVSEEYMCTVWIKPSSESITMSSDFGKEGRQKEEIFRRTILIVKAMAFLL